MKALNVALRFAVFLLVLWAVFFIGHIIGFGDSDHTRWWEHCYFTTVLIVLVGALFWVVYGFLSLIDE